MFIISVKREIKVYWACLMLLHFYSFFPCILSTPVCTKFFFAHLFQSLVEVLKNVKILEFEVVCDNCNTR